MYMVVKMQFTRLVCSGNCLIISTASSGRFCAGILRVFPHQLVKEITKIRFCTILIQAFVLYSRFVVNI